MIPGTNSDWPPSDLGECDGTIIRLNISEEEVENMKSALMPILPYQM
jgi:hypothetical protein